MSIRSFVKSAGVATVIAACLLAAPAKAQKKGGSGDAAKGKAAFEDNCAVCHDVASGEKKMGPSLKGLFKRTTLKNGKKVSEENVKGVINAGGNGMPSYSDMLNDTEKADIIAYLKTV